MSLLRQLTNLKFLLNLATHKSFTLPLVIFHPTGRCNSRCLTCSIWEKAEGDGELKLEEINRLTESLRRLGTKEAIFSGGEPLLHPEIFKICELFRRKGIKLALLTNGLLLEKFAEQVSACFPEVFVSFDGSNDRVLKKIRGVNTLEKIAAGINKLKNNACNIDIIGRSVIQKKNYADLPDIVKKAKEIGFDHISFLPADVTSSAFGRNGQRQNLAKEEILLDKNDLDIFKNILNDFVKSNPQDFQSRFIIESPEKLLRLHQYYAAMIGMYEFPTVRCNAPWISLVIEADGAVKPCFFLPQIGNIKDSPIEQIANSVALKRLRRNLRKSGNPVCKRCVCSLRWRMRDILWM
ncbi:MAG TPA: radical SAM protein [Candidatus Brocadiia bacterium]|nr:radical SAM protein [Planctomycetota bacterium]MDO8093995.1 radical SAM protein [Candidatus Brocadiales bacterium]